MHCRKIRELKVTTGTVYVNAYAGEAEEVMETRAELRARLGDAERLVRRLRADADRQRREVLAAAAGGAGVTNLLFDGALASHAHVCPALPDVAAPLAADCR